MHLIPEWLWYLYAAANITTGIAYGAISLALVLDRKSQGSMIGPMAPLYIGFVGSCGIHHIIHPIIMLISLQMMTSMHTEMAETMRILCASDPSLYETMLEIEQTYEEQVKEKVTGLFVVNVSTDFIMATISCLAALVHWQVRSKSMEQ